MTIQDAVEAEADAGQVMEQVTAGAIEEDVEVVARLAGVALLVENLLELRGMPTTRPLVMQMIMHCSSQII